MWSTYKKVFRFRDCFEKWQMEGDIVAVNNLLKKDQKYGHKGVCITSGAIVAGIANNLEIYRGADDLAWVLEFYNDEIMIATPLAYKEIQLWFEIEEEIETGVVVIHDCEVKGFKEYQN